MGLLDDCKKYFGTEDLYEALCVEKTAKDSEIKKAYRRLSLSVHPDKATEKDKEISTARFQTLAKIHCILSDNEKRKIYDETGGVDDEDGILGSNRDWEEYWRVLFPKVTVSDIEQFAEKYHGSQEETEDLKRFYIRFKGDLDKISEHLMLYDIEREPEYCKTLREMIKTGELEDYPAFSKESAAKRKKRKQRFESEAKECEESGGLGALEQAIIKHQAKREQNFNSLIDRLEQKYASPAASGKKKRKTTK